MLDQRTSSASWGWLLALGILTALFGLIIIANVVAATAAGMAFLGILLLAAAIVQLFAAFRGPDHGSHLLVGILYGLAGVAFLSRPLAASIGLTVIVGFAFIVVGALRLYVGNHVRRVANGTWIMLGGVVSIIAGLMILTGLPTTALWVIGFIIGIEMLMNGITYMLLALGIRHETRALRHA